VQLLCNFPGCMFPHECTSGCCSTRGEGEERGRQERAMCPTSHLASWAWRSARIYSSTLTAILTVAATHSMRCGCSTRGDKAVWNRARSAMSTESNVRLPLSRGFPPGSRWTPPPLSFNTKQSSKDKRHPFGPSPSLHDGFSSRRGCHGVTWHRAGGFWCPRPQGKSGSCAE
jgi:hypothetical protein